ncbi:MAG: efflux RND transporter periplasmic adaptor subunit [Salegentibacter sp.]
MKKIIYTIAFIALSGLTVSCGGDENKETAVKKQPPVKVTLSSPAEGSDQYVTASGKVEAVNNAKLSTRMMGYINKIHVNVGDKVKNGQLLVSINNSDLQAKLAQVNAKITEAKVGYTNAEKDYKRYQALFEENSASQKEMDDMSANYEMAKARLEAAKQMKNEVESQFAYVNIRAPFSGVITNKFADEGDMANPGMPLLAMEAPGAFEVKAMIPESEISEIQPGTKVKVLVKSLDKTLPGKVTEVGSSARNTGGQYPVKVALEKTGENILSGMYATVQFPVEKQAGSSQSVMVPEEALVKHGELTGIYTLSSEGTAILRWIRTGRKVGDKVEVLSGLSADEQYILSADSKLTNGSPVVTD